MSIANVNAVTSGPTRFERNKREHIADIMSVEEKRNASLLLPKSKLPHYS
jgi:hypothetical protein